MVNFAVSNVDNVAAIAGGSDDVRVIGGGEELPALGASAVVFVELDVGTDVNKSRIEI